MIFGGGLVGLFVLGLWIFCILDVISTDEVLVRNMPKLLWLAIVVFLPTIGSIAWLVLGRSLGAGFHIGSRVGVHRPPKRALGPEDSPEFLGNLERRRLEDWEARLRQREDELRRRDDGDQGPGAT